MATSKQDKEFAELMSSNVEATVGSLALDEAIQWVGDNLQPEDVFKEDTLLAWAQTLSPQRVFGDDELNLWAETNGYVKEVEED